MPLPSASRLMLTLVVQVCLQELFSLASREQHDAEACETILYHLLVGILRKLAPTVWPSRSVPSTAVHR